MSQDFEKPNPQLRNSIGMTIIQEGNGASAHIGTNKQYAGYVEFGTGPKGMANHAGTSPEVAVAYTPAPWWIHESQIDPDVPAVYGWPYIETEQGRFYKCSGQPAHPYLYPAVHDNEEMLTDILAGGFKEAMK